MLQNVLPVEEVLMEHNGSQNGGQQTPQTWKKRYYAENVDKKKQKVWQKIFLISNIK
jgi:hypothetical protein